MSNVKIYMEGGGDTRSTKRALRQGMDTFLIDLKEQVRARSWGWNVICCGGRSEAFRLFSDARRADKATIVVLLVDSEGPVNSEPRDHLSDRDDWNLNGIHDDEIHLMVQTMETWIVADKATLQNYYGQNFNQNALPNANNLETVSKAMIANSLEKATRRTQKGIYHKIHHASDLLRRIDPMIVRERCPSCERLFITLDGTIQGA